MCRVPAPAPSSKRPDPLPVAVVPLGDPGRCPDCRDPRRHYLVCGDDVTPFCPSCHRYTADPDPHPDLSPLDQAVNRLNGVLEVAHTLATDILAVDERTDALTPDDHDAVASVRWWLDAVLYDGKAGQLYRTGKVAA